VQNDSDGENIPADLAAHLDYYENPNIAVSSNSGQQEDYDEQERQMESQQNMVPFEEEVDVEED
jgi:hypothetical protein